MSLDQSYIDLNNKNNSHLLTQEPYTNFHLGDFWKCQFDACGICASSHGQGNHSSVLLDSHLKMYLNKITSHHHNSGLALARASGHKIVPHLNL